MTLDQATYRTTERHVVCSCLLVLYWRTFVCGATGIYSTSYLCTVHIWKYRIILNQKSKEYAHSRLLHFLPFVTISMVLLIPRCYKTMVFPVLSPPPAPDDLSPHLCPDSPPLGWPLPPLPCTHGLTTRFWPRWSSSMGFVPIYPHWSQVLRIFQNLGFRQPGVCGHRYLEAWSSELFKTRGFVNREFVGAGI